MDDVLPNLNATPDPNAGADQEAFDPAGPTPLATLVELDPSPPAAGAAAPSAGRRRVFPWAAVAIVAVLAGSALFVAGFSLGRQTALTAGTPAQLQQAFEPFWDAYNAIEQRYAGGTVDRHALIEGAIGGMFKALGDPYSSYMTAEQFKSSLSGVSGQFEGIGAAMTTKDATGVEGCAPLGPDCELAVDHPIAGSPAQRAGLQSGDVVTKVNGQSVTGKTVEQVVQVVRGKRGTPVTLTIARGSRAPFDLTIVRDVINTEDVTSKVLANGEVGYLRVDGFGANSGEEFKARLADLLGKNHVRKLILDVRNDPGGFVDQARLVASQFIGSGPILWQQSADGTRTEQAAEPGGLATDPSIPVAVLVDHGSASASEIVAGALQDAGRARLVGQQSFGKGTMQEWQTLSSDSGGFRLTIAKWLTPKLRSINKVGLTPDVSVETSGTAPAGSDPILQKAIDLLTGPSAALPLPSPHA